MPVCELTAIRRDSPHIPQERGQLQVLTPWPGTCADLEHCDLRPLSKRLDHRFQGPIVEYWGKQAKLHSEETSSGATDTQSLCLSRDGR
jgi:hypothetical protein